MLLPVNATTSSAQHTQARCEEVLRKHGLKVLSSACCANKKQAQAWVARLDSKPKHGELERKWWQFWKT
jgi:hypothetical protein